MGKLFKVLTVVAAGALLAFGVSVDSAAYPDLDRDSHRAYEGFESKGQHPYPHHLIQGESAPKPKPMAKPKPKAKPVAKAVHGSDIVDDDDLIWLRQSAPDKAGLGADYCIDIEVKALEDIADVEIRTAIPDGVTYSGSDPSASVEGDELVWMFDRMSEGETKDLQACFKPNREGEFSYCTTAHANPVACTVTKVGVPRLMIDKTGPEMAEVGDNVTYNIVVSNEGSATAYDVSVKDVIPRGMMYKGGESEDMFEMGDLAPGESERMSITMRADQRGEFCNFATASSSNAGDVSDDACTRVVQPGIEITKSGPAKQFVGKSVNYDIMVRNIGDTDLTGVMVKDVVDSHTRIVDAGDGRMSGRSAEWNVGDLAAGQSRSFNIEVMSDVSGNFCNDASTHAREGVSDNDQACTDWFGHPAILVEVIDTDDPLIAGEETTYIIRVTNQGHASDFDVTVNAMLPSQLSPLSASGDTAGSISGNSVSFASYGELKPKQTIEYKIRAEARSVGDGRLKLEVDSELLKTPVVEIESTHVY